MLYLPTIFCSSFFVLTFFPHPPPLPIPPESAPQMNPAVPDNQPEFVIPLNGGKELLCLSVLGYELFTYNLLSSPFLHVNSFVNVSRLGDGRWERGHRDLGFLVKIRDERVKSGVRTFKIKVGPPLRVDYRVWEL